MQSENSYKDFVTIVTIDYNVIRIFNSTYIPYTMSKVVSTRLAEETEARLQRLARLWVRLLVK